MGLTEVKNNNLSGRKETPLGALCGRERKKVYVNFEG